MGTGIVRSLAAATLGLIATACCQTSDSTAADRPATYDAAPRALGGQAHQWSFLIAVDALDAAQDDSWFRQACTNTVTESRHRQALFAARLDNALKVTLSWNAHCMVSSVSVLTYGGNGCSDSGTSNPSGAYVIFSCPNGEPLVTTK